MNNNDDIIDNWRKFNEIRAERIAKWIESKKVHIFDVCNSKRNYFNCNWNPCHYRFKLCLKSRYFSQNGSLFVIQEIQILFEINIHIFHFTFSDWNLICATWLEPSSISNSVEICFNIVGSIGDKNFILFHANDNKLKRSQCCNLLYILVVFSVGLLSWFINDKFSQNHGRNSNSDTNGQMFFHEMSMATFQLWCLCNGLCYSSFGHLKFIFFATRISQYTH